MIQVIKPGIPALRPNPFKTFVCQQCRCVFKADKQDYKEIWQYNYGTYFSTCPECGEQATESHESRV